MNTFAQLNTYGQTSLNYTDNRQAQVIFDRPIPANQTTTIATGRDHTIPRGIEILDIIDPASMAVYYQINVSSVTGAVVTWPTTPSGCTVTNLSAGVYRMSGITTTAQWNTVRSPTIDIPPGYDTNFTYTSTINYASTSSKAWTTSVTVTTLVEIGSASSLTANLTGIQTSHVAASAVATITKANVGKRKLGQSAMSVVTSMTVGPKLTRGAASLKVGNFSMSTIKLRIRSSAVAMSSASSMTTVAGKKTDTSSTMSPLATAMSITLNSYSYVISSSSNFGVENWIYGSYNIQNSQPSPYVSSQPFQDRHSYKASVYYSLGAYLTTDRSTGAPTWNNLYDSDLGHVKIYYYNGSSWAVQQILWPDVPTTNSLQFGERTVMNGDMCAVSTNKKGNGTTGFDTYFYQRSGTTWSRIQKNISGTGYRIADMSRDGYYISTTDRILKRTVDEFGVSTWAVEATLSGTSNLLDIIKLSYAGDYAAAVGGNDSGAYVSIWSRTGTSWSNPQSFYAPADTINGQSYTSSFNGPISLSDNGNTIWASMRRPANYPLTPNQSYIAVFEKISGTWTRVAILNRENYSGANNYTTGVGWDVTTTGTNVTQILDFQSTNSKHITYTKL